MHLVSVGKKVQVAAQEQQMKQENAALLLEQALFKPEELPVTHWKPRLRLRYSVDDAWYPVRKGPPLLYTEMDAPFRQISYRMYGLGQ